MKNRASICLLLSLAGVCTVTLTSCSHCLPEEKNQTLLQQNETGSQGEDQTLAETKVLQAETAQNKAEVDLSEAEIFDKLTSSDWHCPSDNNSFAGAIDNGGTVAFSGDKCNYPTSQTWLPGRKIDTIISGVSTAGTVRLNENTPSVIHQCFSKLDSLRKESASARKFPYQSRNGVTSLKWNFSKDDKRAGFIFLEDGSAVRFAFGSDGSLYLAGHKYFQQNKAHAKAISESPANSQAEFTARTRTTREQLAKIESNFFKRLIAKDWVTDSTWKVEPGSTPPQQIRFTSDGHFNRVKDQQGNWIKGPCWSLINRDGMHILFDPSGSYYDSSELEPTMTSDHELTLILHVPTYTKYGAKRYEHRFVASTTIPSQVQR